MDALGHRTGLTGVLMLQKRTAEAVQLSSEAASLAAAGQEAERRAAQQTATAQALQRELDDKEESLQRAQKQLKEARSSLEAERAAAGPGQAASQRLHSQMQELQVSCCLELSR